MKIKEWFEDSVDWVKDRVQERTSLDGVMLIAIGVIALLFKDIFADPSKLTPAIVLAFVSVAALPVVSWLSVGILAASNVPEVILSVAKLGI